MRHLKIVLAAATLLVAAPAIAGSYIALGDSITFGETDLLYRQSYGNRGYVDDFAAYLAGRNGGVTPTVINLAIDGETTRSFTSNAGRLPPVEGRNDAVLQLENRNYVTSPLSQSQLFASAVTSQAAIGDAVSTITVTLGFNDLAALANLPTAEALAAAPATLATYSTQYAGILADIRARAPSADLYLLGYYNPFPADPGSPAAPVFNQYGMQLNGIVQELAGLYGARYVDVAPAFVGREAELTYLDDQPHGFFRNGPQPGAEPIGNVHPNEAGYAVIAQRIETTAAVPEPALWAMMLVGFGLVGCMMRRRPAAMMVRDHL